MITYYDEEQGGKLKSNPQVGQTNNLQQVRSFFLNDNGFVVRIDTIMYNAYNGIKTKHHLCQYSKKVIAIVQKFV